MILQFSKMHGLGNDFIVLDGIGQRVEFLAGPGERQAGRKAPLGEYRCCDVAEPDLE